MSGINNFSGSNVRLFSDEESEIGFTDTSQNYSTLAEMSINLEQIVKLYRTVIPIILTACLLSFFFNLLIVCSARWIRRRRLSPNLLLSLSLAAADAFASLIVGLGLVLNSLLPVALGVQLGPNSHCILLALESLRLGSLVSTALHLLALAANHHVGISKPLHYTRIVTRRTTIVSAAAIWLCPIAFFFVYFSSVPDDGFNSFRCSRYDFLLYLPFRATIAALFFIPLIVITAIYIHVFAIVRRHQPRNNISFNKRLRRSIKAAITTLFILGAYIVGWMPAVLYFVITCLDCPIPFTKISLGVRVPIGLTVNSLIVARCLLDPILYLIWMPEVRDALRDMFCVRILIRNSSNLSSLNTRTDVRRLTLLTSKRNINGYANGRNVILFQPKDKLLGNMQ